MQKRQKIYRDKNLRVKICFYLKKVKISEVSEFSILSYTQNRKLGNLGKCSFTSNFDSSCNLRFRNYKNELRQKLKGQDMLLEEKKKISEISEFPILSYTQNRKLGNLGKCSFTSNYDSSCNLRFRNDKNKPRQKPRVIKWIKNKKRKLPRFPSFQFYSIFIYLFIYLLYLTLVYKIVENNSTNKYQQNQVKI